MTIAVEVKHISKTYKIFSADYKRALDALGFPVKYTEFHALDDVSYDFEEGEVTAILGRNGSGKSTLLKLITGVATPTSGDIVVHGRVSAMLELTSGFDGELTGIENIYLKALTMGIGASDVDALVDEIVSFADIGIHIDQPFRTYSSGMKARLGFAVTINIKPDILIVDEVLSVGDDIFKLKCIEKMNEFRSQGKTILFVSHGLSTVKAFCTKAIWINKGKLMAKGDLGEVVIQYEEYLKGERARIRKEVLEARPDEDVVVEKRDIVTLGTCRWVGGVGESDNEFMFGQDVCYSFIYEPKRPIKDLAVSFSIHNTEGIEVYATDKQSMKIPTDMSMHKVTLKLPSIGLIPGAYVLNGEVWDTQSSLCIPHAYKKEFTVVQKEFVGTGVTTIPYEFSVEPYIPGQ